MRSLTCASAQLQRTLEYVHIYILSRPRARAYSLIVFRQGFESLVEALQRLDRLAHVELLLQSAYLITRYRGTDRALIQRRRRPHLKGLIASENPQHSIAQQKKERKKKSAFVSLLSFLQSAFKHLLPFFAQLRLIRNQNTLDHPTVLQQLPWLTTPAPARSRAECNGRSDCPGEDCRGHLCRVVCIVRVSGGRRKKEKEPCKSKTNQNKTKL